MITQRLVKQGRLKAARDGHEWRFWLDRVPPEVGSQPPAPVAPPVTREEAQNASTRAKAFENLARKIMGAHYGVNLTANRIPSVPKLFDFVSPDNTIVGDAKCFSLVHGEMLPPAKFSIIAEHVWLLEKTGCAHAFLAFGNDQRVPVRWLEKYGHLRQNVEFFFIDGEGKLLALA